MAGPGHPLRFGYFSDEEQQEGPVHPIRFGHFSPIRFGHFSDEEQQQEGSGHPIRFGHFSGEEQQQQEGPGHPISFGYFFDEEQQQLAPDLAAEIRHILSEGGILPGEGGQVWRTPNVVRPPPGPSSSPTRRSEYEFGDGVSGVLKCLDGKGRQNELVEKNKDIVRNNEVLVRKPVHDKVECPVCLDVSKGVCTRLLRVTKMYNDLVQKQAELVEVNKDLVKKNVDKLEEYEVLARKHHGLIQQLRDKVECPVCLDVPKKAPIPVCPNGHVVCESCVREKCPMCRVRMGQGKSSLAVTIIENIEHQCGNDGCEKKLLFGEFAKHGKDCDYRLVNCPGCSKVVSVISLGPHMETESCGSVRGNKILNCKFPKVFSYSYDKTESEPEGHIWKLASMKSDESIFVLKVARYDVNGCVRWLFIVQMVGSEEETAKYGVTIIVHRQGDEPGGKHSLIYSGDVCHIDVTSMLAAEEAGLGLTLGDGAMKKILVKNKNSDSVENFSVSVHVYKETP